MLYEAYQSSRAELARKKAELDALADETKAASEAFLAASDEFVAYLKAEGDVAVGASVYSADVFSRLRWRPRPAALPNWRNYVSP